MVAASFQSYFSSIGILIVILSAFLFAFGTILDIQLQRKPVLYLPDQNSVPDVLLFRDCCFDFHRKYFGCRRNLGDRRLSFDSCSHSAYSMHCLSFYKQGALLKKDP